MAKARHGRAKVSSNVPAFCLSQVSYMARGRRRCFRKAEGIVSQRKGSTRLTEVSLQMPRCLI